MKEKAQSTIIGFTLILLIMVFLLSIYQSAIVPTIGQEIEQESDSKVKNSMIRFDSAVQRSIASETVQTVILGDSIDYIPSILSVNNVKRKFNSTHTGKIRVKVESSSGTEFLEKYDTHTLKLSSSYAFLKNSTSFDYEHSVLHQHPNTFEIGSNRTVIRNGQKIVNDNSITLVTVGEIYETSDNGEMNIDISPNMSKYEEETIGQDATDIRIRLPTKLPKEKWEEIYSEELDNNRVDLITYTETADGDLNTVEIHLDEDDTYKFSRYHVDFD